MCKRRDVEKLIRIWKGVAVGGWTGGEIDEDSEGVEDIVRAGELGDRKSSVKCEMRSTSWNSITNYRRKVHMRQLLDSSTERNLEIVTSLDLSLAGHIRFATDDLRKLKSTGN